MIRLSVSELRKLLLKVLWQWLSPAEQVLEWSEWRRRHQYRARERHFRKRGTIPPDD